MLIRSICNVCNYCWVESYIISNLHFLHYFWVEHLMYVLLIILNYKFTFFYIALRSYQQKNCGNTVIKFWHKPMFSLNVNIKNASVFLCGCKFNAHLVKYYLAGLVIFKDVYLCLATNFSNNTFEKRNTRYSARRK